MKLSFFKYFKIGFSYLLLISIALIFIAPLLWMLSSSLHDLQGVFEVPFKWFPAQLQWNNYQEAITLLPFGTFLLNTILITGLVILGTVISSALVAYGFSRLRFWGRNKLFALCLATMLLPGQVTIIPLYVLFARLGWVDTFLPLIVPAFFGSPFYIFLLRQFFLTIPYQYDEAALLDGASRFRIFWNIIFPLARPAIATVVVFSFIGTWNDFFNPLIYINSFENATLTLGLNLLKTQIIGSGVTQWHLIMAASVLVLIPNIIIFFLAQQHFMKGINVGGLKA
ncbi:carbohydrate ABC transporter permease [candidate division KSB1 bacterium]|nr:carbohydrate ABC transporter permease [candidate division KSB1 bacterium]